MNYLNVLYALSHSEAKVHGVRKRSSATFRDHRLDDIRGNRRPSAPASGPETRWSQPTITIICAPAGTAMKQ